MDASVTYTLNSFKHLSHHGRPQLPGRAVGVSAVGTGFDRQSVYDAGGGPVLYAWPDDYFKVGVMNSRVQSWLVRLVQAVRIGSRNASGESRLPVVGPR